MGAVYRGIDVPCGKEGRLKRWGKFGFSADDEIGGQGEGKAV